MSRINTATLSSPRTVELGQVFTPRPVADWMARWACSGRPRRILDPALGAGVFVEAVQSLYHTRHALSALHIDAYEIDEKVLRQFSAKDLGLPIRIHRRDFILSKNTNVYDSIVANPPYVRHHDMTYGEDVFCRFDEVVGARLSRSTNLYGLFLIKMWTLLAAGGRAAVITPAEWLNADFGRAIKAYFLRHNAIEGIIHFDHAAQVFDGTLTTAAIMLLQKGRLDDAPVMFSSVASIDDLQSLQIDDGRGFDPRRLDPAMKWTPLFCEGADTACGTGPTLGDIARCRRGIATGANEYFALRESERLQHGIDIRDVRSCITKARQVGGERITQSDVRRWVDENQRVFLIDPRPRLGRAIERYLELGRRLGLDRRHLPAHRPVWYRPERRMPAPILISVFARGQFKVALNEAGVLNLTAYHGIYPLAASASNVRAIFEYLRSRQGREALLRHHRIYARGLLKVEPRDVEAMSIPVKLFEQCQEGATKHERGRSPSALRKVPVGA